MRLLEVQITHIDNKAKIVPRMYKTPTVISKVTAPSCSEFKEDNAFCMALIDGAPVDGIADGA